MLGFKNTFFFISVLSFSHYSMFPSYPMQYFFFSIEVNPLWPTNQTFAHLLLHSNEFNAQICNSIRQITHRLCTELGAPPTVRLPYSGRQGDGAGWNPGHTGNGWWSWPDILPSWCRTCEHWPRQVVSRRTLRAGQTTCKLKSSSDALFHIYQPL